MRLAVNARVASLAMGGQQRVTSEIIKRLGDVDIIRPDGLAGIKAHLWEQAVLPVQTRGQLLWSPSATGPLVKSRQVVTLHDVAFFDVPEFFSATFGRYYRKLVPALMRRAAAVVTVSEFSRQRIAASMGIAAERVMVIPNGVTGNFRRHGAEEIAATRQALALPGRYLLLQATSDRRKNLARVLKVWTALQDRLPPGVELVVSGKLSGGHVFGEVGRIEDAPRTRLLGFIDEAHMGPLMSGAEAFLFPSLYEGFGLPIIEAMACGTPVLTSAATATQEVAGDAALLVDPASEQSIAEGILTMLADGDLRARLVEAGEGRLRLYDWDDAADQYRRLFSSLGAPMGPMGPKQG